MFCQLAAISAGLVKRSTNQSFVYKIKNGDSFLAMYLATSMKNRKSVDETVVHSLTKITTLISLYFFPNHLGKCYVAALKIMFVVQITIPQINLEGI